MFNLKSPLALLIFLSLNSFGAASIIVRGGLNAADANLDPDIPTFSGVEKGFRQGIDLALLGELPINDVVHVLAGPGFENKGFKLYSTSTSSNDRALARFDYVTFPVLLSFGSSGAGNRIFFNAGLEPDILIASNVDTNDNGTVHASNVSRFDLALCGEAGGEVPVSSTGNALIFGVGYSYGLFHSLHNPGDAMSSDYFIENAHNYVFKIFVGFKFDLHSGP